MIFLLKCTNSLNYIKKLDNNECIMFQRIIQFITIVVIFICVNLSAFANTQVSILSSKSEYDIDDIIDVRIEIDTGGSDVESIDIPWLSTDFQIVGQDQRETYSSINGAVSKTIQLRLSLLALAAWEASLWPITLTWKDWEIVRSETLKLTITWERIMVDNKLKSFQNNLWVTPKLEEDDTEEKDEIVDQNIDNVILNPDKDTQVSKQAPLWLDGKQMNDIYQIKDYIYDSPFAKHSFWVLFFLVIAGILYRLLSSYLSKNLHIKEEKEEEIIILKSKNDYAELLGYLESRIDWEKWKFYHTAWKIVRLLIWEKMSLDLSRKSLKEVEYLMEKNNFNHKKLWFLYNTIYYPVYEEIEKKKEWSREEIFEKIKKEVLAHTTK